MMVVLTELLLILKGLDIEVILVKLRQFMVQYLAVMLSPKLLNSDSQTVTGQVDTIDVIEPGFNYNPDDTITFIDASTGAELNFDSFGAMHLLLFWIMVRLLVFV